MDHHKKHCSEEQCFFLRPKSNAGRSACAFLVKRIPYSPLTMVGMLIMDSVVRRIKQISDFCILFRCHGKNEPVRSREKRISLLIVTYGKNISHRYTVVTRNETLQTKKGAIAQCATAPFSYNYQKKIIISMIKVGMRMEQDHPM